MRSIALLLIVATSAIAQLTPSLDLAEDYQLHGLSDRAKEVYIALLHDPASTEQIKADALYELGRIAFMESRGEAALAVWQRLVDEYPTSGGALEIQDRIMELQEAIGRNSETNITWLVARSYIEHGDFWSKATTEDVVSSEWLVEEEMALKWYDATIRQFGGTPAAELAFRRKIMTLIGWPASGPYDEGGGTYRDFAGFMPLAVAAFEAFAVAFPASPMLQPLRYQIAQAYWRNEKAEQAKEWFGAVVEGAEGVETFYAHLAAERLKKLGP